MGLDVTDRIELFIHGPEDVREAVEAFADHLAGETLAVSWEWKELEMSVEAECGGMKCSLYLRKSDETA